jgi:hypothetical protein
MVLHKLQQIFKINKGREGYIAPPWRMFNESKACGASFEGGKRVLISRDFDALK